MTDKEVQDIFAEELTNKSTKEALMASQNRIAVQILSGLIGPEIDDGVWGMLKDITYAKSRLSMFLGIAAGSLIQVEEGMLGKMVFLYGTWLQVVIYLYNNYEDLNSEEFKKGWDRETTLSIKNELSEKYNKLERQFVMTQTLAINHQDFPLMEQTYNWALLAILGREHFNQFREEFNKTAVLLRKYQTELRSPPA